MQSNTPGPLFLPPTQAKLQRVLAETERDLDREFAERNVADDAELERIAQKIDVALTQTTVAILEIGRCLKCAHERLAGSGRDGKFGPWVKNRFGFSAKTAYNYLAANRVFGREKCETVSHFDATALYLLSTTDCPKQVTANAIELADKGERISRKVAKALVDEAANTGELAKAKRGKAGQAKFPASDAFRAIMDNILLLTVGFRNDYGDLSSAIKSDGWDSHCTQSAKHSVTETIKDLRKILAKLE